MCFVACHFVRFESHIKTYFVLISCQTYEMILHVKKHHQLDVTFKRNLLDISYKIVKLPVAMVQLVDLLIV